MPPSRTVPSPRSSAPGSSRELSPEELPPANLSAAELPPRVFRTIDQKLKGNPLDPHAYGEQIKPGELVDIVELATLTLTDRRTYNILLANAWPRISERVVHRIAKAHLKGSHYGNDRIEDSINKLMGTIAIIRFNRNGKWIKRRVQLLGPNDEEIEERGYLYYRFPEELVEIIVNSDVYARLKSQIMFCFESKYGLYLYELIERRKGLDYVQCEEFDLDELRKFMNVPDSKLQRFADFNKYALKVAIREVNALCDFWVRIEPVKNGRKVERIRLHWFPKTPEGKLAAIRELDRHSAGRRARLDGTVDEVALW
jgi:hypothetical protein